MAHDGRWAREVTIYCCRYFCGVVFLALPLPYANCTRLSELVLVFVLGLTDRAPMHYLNREASPGSTTTFEVERLDLATSSSIYMYLL